MRRHHALLYLLLATLCLAVQLPTARAGISYTGDIDPADPNDWDGYTDGYVGKADDGTLTIDDGLWASDLICGVGYIGYNNGVNGTVSLDKIGSMWICGYPIMIPGFPIPTPSYHELPLYIGYSGNGTLNINNGSVRNSSGYIGYNPGSSGIVLVDGPDSSWSSGPLYIGDAGSGTLNITGGATVNSKGTGYIGYTPDSMGTVTVAGANSKWTSSKGFYIGYDGNGRLDIINDSMVTGQSSSYIGYNAGSTGIVNIAGSDSALSIPRLYVGYSGNGTFNNNGGILNNEGTVLGYNSGSTGILTVDGATSSLTTDYNIYVGLYGNGILNIYNGGSVESGESIGVAYNEGSTGSIDFGISGGSLTTRTLYASPEHLKGAGCVNVRGLVSDINLLFDSESSLIQELTFTGLPDQDITVNLNISDSNNVGLLGAGYYSNGSITVKNGTSIYTDSCLVGYHVGSSGVVTIEGADSTWATRSGHFIYSGKLNIINGGAASGSNGYIGNRENTSGTAMVNGDNSTWSVQHLEVGYRGNGILSIINGGTVIGENGSIGVRNGVTGLLTIDGDNSSWTASGIIYSGMHGNGVLNITNGGKLTSSSGCIGHFSDSTGVVNVEGANSIWTTKYGICIGNEGDGSLTITGGAAVSSDDGCIGFRSGSTGVVTVDGAGSTWTNGDNLHVGDDGSGTLNIIGGGAVTAESVLINNYSPSLLAIDVGNGSLLNIGNGSGTITNDGTVRILAGAGAATAGVYSPISATTWEGDGIYQAVGGTWNETTHEFTVSGVQSGTSGTMATLDLAGTQRLLINDGGTGWSLGASFLAMDVSSTLNLTATAFTGEALADLEALIGSSETVLGAWELIVAGDGYTEGDPAYLSFDIGAGFSRNDLQAWHFDGTDWTEFDAMDLTCNGAYASFTVTGFSGYAVSAVPEPGTLALLIAAALGLLAHARRKWK